jgi:peptidyl-prolyl cis-trans isomerase B (cyclophilin B)
MKYTILSIAALSLVFLGAGCQSVPTEINEELEAAIGASETNEIMVQEISTVTLDELTAIPTSFPGVLPENERVGKVAVIKTGKGTIEVELNGELAPKTVSNFIALSHTGFYDGLTFHRREPGFVIQGGDPSGNGTGGPGYTVEAEIVPELKHDAYAIAMARQPDQVNPLRASSGSQFYITLDATPFLDGAYTVFGKVLKGEDVVDEIAIGDVIESIEIK